MYLKKYIHNYIAWGKIAFVVDVQSIYYYINIFFTDFKYEEVLCSVVCFFMYNMFTDYNIYYLIPDEDKSESTKTMIAGLAIL